MASLFGSCVCALTLLPSWSLALSSVHRTAEDLRQVPRDEEQLAATLKVLSQDEMLAKEARSIAELAVEKAWEAEAKYQEDFGGPPPTDYDKYFYINRSAVKMPSFWDEDYTWGHSEIMLYPEGLMPGHRDSEEMFGLSFNESNTNQSEWNVLVETDPSVESMFTVMGCTPPGNQGSGHIMLFSQNATIVPFIVDKEKQPASSDAAVLVIPGGGGQLLAWDAEGISVAQWLNWLGIHAFVLQYRTPSSNQVDLMDAQRAMSLLRHNAAKYGIDANRIGAIGFSHGGYVALEGLVQSQRAYSPIDDVDDVDYAPNFLMLLYPETPNQAIINSSYAGDLLQRLPPTFWAHSLADTCVGIYNQPFINAMQDHPVPQVQMHIYQQGSHAFASCELEPELRGLDVCQWKLDAAEFLNMRVLKH